MKKWIIPIVTLLILVGGVAAGIFLVGQPAEFREKAAPATTLTFNTQSTTVNVGDDFTVSVQVNSGENLINGVQLAIHYDANILKAKSVTKGNYFGDAVTTTSPLILPPEGLIDYTIALPGGSTPVQGSGTVAIISFSAISEGSSTLSFINSMNYEYDGKTKKAETIATEPGEIDSVLASTTPITIIVQSVSSAPTATPTPTPTDNSGVGGTNLPTATPTPTTQPTATPTPTPTDNSGVGGTNLPTATPIPTTTATNTPTPTSALLAQNLTTPTPTRLMDSGFEDYTIVYLIVGTFSILLSGLLVFSTKN